MRRFFSRDIVFPTKKLRDGERSAEVVAGFARLRETFVNFKLPVHPSYFAGIPGATLAALLSANKRAELIELAVAGYLRVTSSRRTTSLSR